MAGHLVETVAGSLLVRRMKFENFGLEILPTKNGTDW